MLMVFKQQYIGIETGGLYVEKGQRVDVPEKYVEQLEVKGLAEIYIKPVTQTSEVEEESPKKRGRKAALST